MQNRNKIISAVLSLTATLMAGQALAAGTVSGVTTDKASITLGQSLNANVQGTINKDVFKKGCQVKITLKYADNSTEIAHPGLLVDAFPATGFYLKPAKSGQVKVIADGGGTNNLGWPACLGSAQTQINVAALVVVDPHPTVKVNPGLGSSPANTGVTQVSAASLQLAPVPTLTSIKQVPYTDQGGETWIEVQGTGVCAYTIEGAGTTTSHSSSAATPFPMKVKIAGAPIGSHLWNAKGTGKCTGTASTQFTVNQ